MPNSTAAYTVAQHFEGRDPAVKQAYAALVKAAKTLGPVKQDPKKTSIHLVRKTAFAGVMTRKTALILTLKSGSALRGARIVKSERVSANRWHVDVRLEGPDDVDREVAGWLGRAYDLSG
jgi:hypothetical protein